MKKLFWMTNLGWLLVTGIIVAKATSKASTSVSMTPDVTSCETCNSDQFFGLDAETVMKGIARYRKFQYKAINGSVGQFMKDGNQDARSCWYSIDTLKKFICLIEAYSKFPPLNFNSKQLGIRFYYAAYDSTEDLPIEGLKRHGGDDVIIHHSLALRHTLFMVPTVHDSVLNLNTDFDPRISAGRTIEQIKDYVGEPGPPYSADISSLSIWNNYQTDPHAQLMVLDGSTANDKKKVILARTKPLYTQPPIPSGKNQGNLCPPTCSGKSQSLLDQVDQTWPDSKITQQ